MPGPGLSDLEPDAVREALRLLGTADPPSQRAAALRELAEEFAAPGAVKAILDRAPEGARTAFTRLAHNGPASVEDLLGRGWWGKGALPPPLDWLQRRALVLVGSDGLVHATAEARGGFRALTLDVGAPAPPEVVGTVRVEPARTVVVAPDAAGLERTLAVAGAGLRAVAATVAVSEKAPKAVEAALRAAGVRLDADEAVRVEPDRPALPGTPEVAVGPRAVRALFERAAAEQRQLRLQYFASSRGGAATERTVDPWEFRDDLLRGYCHLREGERTFAVDRVGRATLLASPIAQRPAGR